MNKNHVLITGVTGQDGSFLAEQLLARGQTVFGLVRRSSSPNYWRLKSIIDHEKFHLIEGDITDLSSVIRIVKDLQPQYLYNLASQSFVPTSWEQPILTAHATGLGAVNIFESVRIVSPETRIYQASSSEMFGLQPNNALQSEDTPFYPRSPYGCAKAYAHQMGINYRESHGLFIVNGILFNHESERRGERFVTRKITKAVAEIKLGLKNHLPLGRLDTARDWGFAGDYVEAMALMIESDTPRDFVIATGKRFTVEYFVESAFNVVGLDWRKYVTRDERYMRPAEVPSLCGDAKLAHKHLGWQPKMNIEQLIERMVVADLNRLKD